MKALTFSISFFTAHFKTHKAKRFRDTYVIPLPSTIAGIIGAIMNIERDSFKKWSEDVNLYCGAKLVSYSGFGSEYSILWKFDNFRDLVRTPDITRFVIEPSYVFAIAVEDSVFDELHNRLINLRFEASIFGGSDYHFVRDIGDVREAVFKSGLDGEGYVPRSEFRGIKPFNGAAESYFAYVRGNIREDFVFVYRGLIESKEELNLVDDGVNKVFVYKASEFISV